MYTPQQLAQLHQGYLRSQGIDPNGPQPQAPPPPAPVRRGVTKFLPAIGAAAAGIAAAPFTGGLSLAGTLAALGAAGAVGGAAGEFGAQKAAHENTNFGKVAKEGVESGVLSAIPLGGVGRAAKVASQVEGDAATQAAKAAMDKGITGKIANAGRRLETRAGGFGIGEKMTGNAPVTIQAQKDIQATLRNEGIKAGHPEDQAIFAQNKLAAYHDQMDKALTTSNRALKPAEINQIKKDYLAQIENSPTVDANVRKYAQQFAANLGKVKDVKGLNAFRRGVDQNAISYIANPDAATAAKTEAAQVLRRKVSDAVGQYAPEVKAVNGKYAKLSNATDYLTQQAGRLTRQSENAGGGVVGRVITGDTAQTVKSKVGAALQKVPTTSAAATAPGFKRTAATELTKQVAGRSLADVLTGANAAQAGPAPAGGVDYTAAIGPGGDGTDASGAGADQQQQPSMYSLQQALTDIQNDPKHADTYLSIYKTVSSAEQAASKGASAPHGIVSAQSYSNAQSGQQALQSLAAMLNKNPALAQKASVPGQELPVVGGYVQHALGTNEYQALAHNVADAVLRLRTGATANEGEIRLYMHQFMPQAGDDPATIQQKLRLLASNFQPYLSQGGPNDASSLTQQLLAAQAQTAGAY